MSDEEDDGPAIVDESGENLGREALEKLAGGTGDSDTITKERRKSTEGAADHVRGDTAEKGNLVEIEKPKEASIGWSRKRKTGRLLGFNDNAEVDATTPDYLSAERINATTVNRNSSRPEKTIPGKTKPNKKIKLSFDEDEVG